MRGEIFIRGKSFYDRIVVFLRTHNNNNNNSRSQASGSVRREARSLDYVFEKCLVRCCLCHGTHTHARVLCRSG